jgi:AraC family ethanolamine operon transcriptional activator
MTSGTLAPAGRAIAAEGVKVARRRYRDIEAQATSIVGHQQTYTQMTRGRFEGRLESYVVSDRAAFFVESANQSIRKQFQVLPGHLRVGFLLEGIACHGNGIPLATGDTSVNLSSTSLDLHFGETHRGCWVTLAEAEVAAMMPPGKERWTLAKTGRSQVRGSAAAVFQQTIATAREQLFKRDLPAPGPAVVAAFERSIVSAAAWALTSAFAREAEPKRSRAAHRTHLLRRACEVIDAKLACGLTMSRLCSIIGTSRRTLENIFIEAFGVSPYQYVRTLRLNAIRRELLSENNAGVSIGDIAARWGVWHFSRFAADYRDMFGKLPSQERIGPCCSPQRVRRQRGVRMG